MIGYSSFLEQPNYLVLQNLPDGVEIREYGNRTFAESRINGTGISARRDAFRTLFNYISGENDTGQKVSMTIPVSASEEKTWPREKTQTSSSNSNIYTMRFFLPKKYDTGSAPKPKNQEVKIGLIPSRLEAALRYTGSQSDSRAKIYENRLLGRLNSSNWRPIGPPVALYYNPPFSIPILRRNEITVPIEKR